MFRFGKVVLDVDRRELWRDKALVSTEPQVFDVLVYLLRNRHRVVTRDDLLSAVWGGRIVSESTLASRIAAVRDAVGDTGRDKQWVRTVARRGFRFVGEVTEHVGHPPCPPNVPETSRVAEETVKRTPVRGRGLRRQMTFLSCVMLDPSTLAADTDPEDLNTLTGVQFERLKRIADKHKAAIVRHLPDITLLHFGHPHVHENDAESAVRAALEIIESEPVNRPRIGIATGVVVVNDAADPGAGDDPMPVGQAALISAALSKHAESGTILVAASTQKLVGGLFEYELVEAALPIAAMQPWRIVRETRDQHRFSALRSSTIPMFGRKEELQILSRRWRRTKSGDGQVVLICGEPGIGKSRLVSEARIAAGVTDDALQRLSCAPHRQQTALYPVVTLVAQAAGIEDGDTETIKRTKLWQLLGATDSDTRDFELFAELLSVAGSSTNSPSDSPQRRREVLSERFIARFVTGGKPKMLVLEDAHWIDPTTMELLDLLVERAPGLPLLLIVTYRPAFSPPWLGQSHVTSITLKRLEKRDNALMVRQLAHGHELPEPLLVAISNHSDGVPLFIEEMTKSIVEKLVHDGGVKVSSHLMEVPDSLQPILLERLDRIASARVVAQAGAALGRDFTYSMIKAATQLDDAVLGFLLGQLVASELVQQRGAVPHSLYRFKHALVQDAAYGTMLKDQRVEVHHRIVDAIELYKPDALERDPDVLAHHATEARLWEKAINYRLKATRMALDRSAGMEAEAEVRAAFAVLPSIANSATRRTLEGRLHAALGEVFILSKGFAAPDVATALVTARTLLPKGAPELVRASCGLFNYHLMRSEAPLALQQCEPLFQSQPRGAVAVVANFLSGAAHLPMGDFEVARRLLETSLSLWDDSTCKSIAFVTGHHLRTFMLVWLGLAKVCTGQVRSAHETMLSAVRDARERRHAFTLVSALLASARFHLHIRDVKGSVTATEEGLVIAQEQRSPYHISRANVLRAINMIEGDRPGEGIDLMQQALLEHRATGANFQSSFSLSHLAIAHARVGEHGQAQKIALEAIEDVERSGERWWEAEAHRMRGIILLLDPSPDMAGAESSFITSLECARRQQAKLWELRAALSLARLWRHLGKSKESYSVLERIRRSFANDIAIPDIGEAEEMLS